MSVHPIMRAGADRRQSHRSHHAANNSTIGDIDPTRDRPVSQSCPSQTGRSAAISSCPARSSFRMYPLYPRWGTFRISRADMAVPARTPSGHDRPGRRLRHPPPETPPASRRRGRCDGGRRRTIRAVTAAGFTGADRRFPRRNPRDCGCRRRRSAHRLRGRRFRGRPGAPVRPRPRCAP
jgi:hypothetical protein